MRRGAARVGLDDNPRPRGLLRQRPHDRLSERSDKGAALQVAQSLITANSKAGASCPGLTYALYAPECVEGKFSEVRRHGVLGSWLRGSADGIMLVVEGDVPL